LWYTLKVPIDEVSSMRKMLHLSSALLLLTLGACSGSDSGQLTRGDIRAELSATDGLTLYHRDTKILSSQSIASSNTELREGDAYSPFAISSTTHRKLDEQYGYYLFDDRIDPYRALTITAVKEEGRGGLSFEFGETGSGTLTIEDNVVRLRWSHGSQASDRLAMTFACEESDRFFGLGAHVSTEHRGYDVPIWVSEQGHGKVERGESSPIFFVVGEHYSSYVPVPFALTNRPLGLLLDTTERSHFELCSHAESLRLEVQGPTFELVLFVGDSMAEVLTSFTEATGRIEPPARWNLAPIIDAGGGPEEVERLAQLARDEHIPASAIWVEDWVGIQEAFGGEHLHYNWEVDEEMYPNFSALTAELEGLGLRFLTYVSPYVPNDTAAAQAGLEGGYLVEDASGEPIVIEYPWGAPPYYFDMTSPGAEAWFQSFVARAHSLGVDGWMADFGEALPYDGLLGDGRTGKEAHNDYPRRWTGANLDAWKSVRPNEDFMLFTRSGYTGSASRMRIHWLGDQMTSFDRNDGLGSVIPLYLSAGLSGIPLTHSDVGGYAKAIGHNRTFEVWARWLEFEAFTPVMRTHHGSEPHAVVQWYSTPESRSLFQRYARWHQRLLPYFMMLAEEAARTGTPACRPIWWGNEERTDLYQIDTEMLVGQNLLLAPILEAAKSERTVTFPPGSWARWSDFDLPLKAPITTNQETISASESEAIVFVGAGAALPLLTEDYESMAPPQDGIARPGIHTAPSTLSSLGFLLTPGGSSTGSLQNESFGMTSWRWDAESSSALTTTGARVNGSALGACDNDSSTHCIIDSQSLRVTRAPSESTTLSLSGGDAELVFESDTVTELSIRL
jgi:alpha-glucosidase